MTVIELIHELQMLVGGKDQEVRIWCSKCEEERGNKYGDAEHEVVGVSLKRDGVIWINGNA